MPDIIRRGIATGPDAIMEDEYKAQPKVYTGSYDEAGNPLRSSVTMVKNRDGTFTEKSRSGYIPTTTANTATTANTNLTDPDYVMSHYDTTNKSYVGAQGMSDYDRTRDALAFYKANNMTDQYNSALQWAQQNGYNYNAVPVSPVNATPGQVINGGVAPAGALSVGGGVIGGNVQGYQSGNPYSGTVNDILAQLWQKQSAGVDLESSPLYQSTMDAANLQADKQAKGAMETLNSRGIVNSTITADRVAQAKQDVMTQVLPALIEKVYGINQQEMQNLMSLANTYSDMASNYDSNVIAQQEAVAAQKQAEIDAAKDQLKQAIDATNAIGYVPNWAAAILGVEPGTPSWDAQKAAGDLSTKLQIAEMNNQTSLQKSYISASRVGRSSGGSGGASSADEGGLEYYNFSPDNLVEAMRAIASGSETLESIERDLNARYKYGQIGVDEYNNWMRELRPELIDQYTPQEEQAADVTEEGYRYIDPNLG